jgi:uncharacterized protein (DUF927 family)
MNDGTILITPDQGLTLGWSVIPTNRSKRAMIEWREYQARLPTPQELALWQKLKPAAWAIVTGAISRRFTLDFDGQQGHQTIQSLHLTPHRTTPNNGYHVDFAYPGWRISTVSGTIKTELGERWPGLDIRGDGGYVCFTGELQQGRRYAWLRDPAADDIGKLPVKFIDFLQHLPAPAAEPEPARPKPSNGNPPANDTRIDAGRLMRQALEMIPQKGRNASGFWFCTQLRDNRYSQSEAHDHMMDYRQHCPKTNAKGREEEYTEREVLATIDQTYGRAQRGAWEKQGKTKITEPESTVTEPKPAIQPRRKPSHPGHYHYEVSDRGVSYVNQEDEKRIWVCSRLDIVAQARDENSECWGRILRWKDEAGKTHRWVVAMKMLQGQSIQVRETLADGGLLMSLDPKTSHLLAQYIANQEPERSPMYCVPHIGWFDRSFVFPDSAVPADADVSYQSTARGEHFYRSRGTLEQWRENIARKCIGNSRLTFAMSAAFAGPLLRLLNVQGGGFHFSGPSSLGKSTTQWVAGSVWGGGGRNGFARTWASTKNALESIAELHNDACLILDEMRLIDPRDVEQIVYMLANGSGKSRENKTMTGRRTLEWLELILSSGEIKLSDCAALAGQKVRGGAEIRMATIPADAGEGIGIFETLHGTNDPRIFAETLESAAKTWYGTAAPAFLEYVIANYDEILEHGNTYINNLTSKLMGEYPGAAPEVRRVCRRFMLGGFGGEAPTQAGITGWSRGDATAAAVKLFREWLEYRGGWDTTDSMNAIRQIRGIIAGQHNRFRPADPPIDKETGEAIIVTDRLPDALGYWQNIEGEMVYLIDQEAFRSELCAGFDHTDVLQELARRNLLYINEDDRHRRTARTTVTTPAGDKRRGRWIGIVRDRILATEKPNETSEIP